MESAGNTGSNHNYLTRGDLTSNFIQEVAIVNANPVDELYSKLDRGTIIRYLDLSTAKTIQKLHPVAVSINELPVQLSSICLLKLSTAQVDWKEVMSSGF